MMKAPAGLKSPAGLVTVALTAAILLAATLVIATSTRGEETVFGSSAGELDVRTFARGLVHPWSLAFLPDGTILVTERPGRMRIVTMEGQLSPPLKGVPEVWASGQGGLLDVAIDKSFSQNKTIFFCFSERTDGGGRTAVARAKLNDGGGRLDDTRIIFRQEGPLSSGNHYGCRIAQADDGNLFVTLGEHFAYRDQAQNLGNHLGKLIRIAPDGSVPAGNPFIGRADARPEIWSYGHRNEQGLAINPASGELWEIELGPRHADHSDRVLADPKLPTDDAVIAAEARRPQSMAQHYALRFAGAVVIIGEETSGQRSRPQCAKEVSSHGRAVNVFRLVAREQREIQIYGREQRDAVE